MFGKKKDKPEPKKLEKVTLKDISYPPKIILAWAKSMDGHPQIAEWLRDNGYNELVMANHAINLKDEARAWLITNGYPHLMAMINACEGNETAQKWLIVHGLDKFYHMALAIDGEMESWDWLGKNVPADIFLLTQTIKKIKDNIEESHNDIHTFGRD
ncbi:hypothetical protein N8328_05285 [Crocinitomicaceae bacterium]|nr:hypothetical protein [Crocinitomicaceae bacterium]